MHVVRLFAFAKVPVPFDVHVTLVWLTDEAPAVIFTAPEEEHVVTFVPADATIKLLTVSDFVEVALPQGDVP